jgi:hypothetical protein
MGEQLPVLEYESDIAGAKLVPAPVGRRLDVVASKEVIAVEIAIQHSENAEQRGLSRATFAANDVERAGLDRQVESFEDFRYLPVRRFVEFAQVV